MIKKYESKQINKINQQVVYTSCDKNIGIKLILE